MLQESQAPAPHVPARSLTLQVLLCRVAKAPVSAAISSAANSAHMKAGLEQVFLLA